MANFDSGVKAYVKTSTIVKVYFPISFRDHAEIACKHCPFLSANERVCQLNKEPVAFPMTHVGAHCPLEPISEEDMKYVQRDQAEI